MSEIPNEAAQVVRDALDTVADILEHITDPLRRAEACDLASVAAAQAQVELKAFRAAAFHEARQSISVEQIARACGITKARVYQILDGR
jgi:hypothetical protein